MNELKFDFRVLQVIVTRGMRVTRGRRVTRGSRVGAVVKALASHQCGPVSIPGLDVICGLSLLLVFYSAPRGFSPGTPVFLS